MAKQGFVADSAAIRRLLQSQDMLDLTISYAHRYGDDLTSFIGFDRAKTIVHGDNNNDRSHD